LSSLEHRISSGFLRGRRGRTGQRHWREQPLTCLVTPAKDRSGRVGRPQKAMVCPTGSSQAETHDDLVGPKGRHALPNLAVEQIRRQFRPRSQALRKRGSRHQVRGRRTSRKLSESASRQAIWMRYRGLANPPPSDSWWPAMWVHKLAGNPQVCARNAPASQWFMPKERLLKHRWLPRGRRNSRTGTRRTCRRRRVVIPDGRDRV